MILQKKETKKRIKKRRKAAGWTLAALAVVFVFLQYGIKEDVRFVPVYEKTDLTAYAEKTSDILSDEDYRLLLAQTGLGKPAVDKIFAEAADPEEELLSYQQSFFTPPEVQCDKIGIITFEERLVNDQGETVKGFALADVRNGDILITKATHSVGWRHGHAAVVVDAETGKTAEAVIWGTPTSIQNLSLWRAYPTLIQLRIEKEDIGNHAAYFAENKMVGVDYGLLTGIPSKNPKKMQKTQCAHLPWYVYRQFGYDLDSDGGWLVTPKDLAGSSELVVVQIFGVDPEKLWP